MNVQSILVLVVIFVLLGIAIGFICNSKQELRKLKIFPLF